MAGIVDIQALRGYDSPSKSERKAKKLKEMPPRFCSHQDCKVKLSVYNTTESCAQHQKNNKSLLKDM